MIRRVLLAVVAFTMLAGALPAQSATFNPRVLVILADFSNTSPQYPASLAQGVMFDNPNSIKQFWADSSSGQVQVSGEVHGWYEIPSTNQGCAITTWEQQARAAAAADGVDLAAFPFKVYGFSFGQGCPFLGQAGGSLKNNSGVMDIPAGFNQGTLIHESGHMFGIGFHPPHTDFPGGPESGGAIHTFFYGPQWTASGGERSWQGIAIEQTVTASGTYTLPTLDTSNVLVVPRGDGSRLVLDYRRVTYPQWSDTPLNGVTVWYLKTQAAEVISAGCFGSGISQGRSWYDALARIAVQVDSLTPTAATVTVTLNADDPNATPDTTAPSVPIGLQVKRAKSPALSWTPSTDDRDCAPQYKVFRNGTQIATTTSSAYTDTTAPRRTTISYFVKAFDAAGNVSAQSGTVSVKT